MPQPQLDRDARRTLLDALAAKRRAQAGGGGRAQVVDLEDSSEDEASFATARSLVSEDENDENTASTSGQPQSRLQRLRKAGNGAAAGPAAPRQAPPPPPRRAAVVDDDSDDDIAAQLGGLTIKARAGGAATLPPPPPRPQRQPAPAAPADADCLVLGSNNEFRLNATASRMLYPHQVEGVKWLWSLRGLGSGGILADDMGLGKTIQCAAFLSGLIDSRLIKRAIVVAPKTLLAQWRKELGLCGLGRATHEYDGTPNQREAALDAVVRLRGVLLTTYGMVLHNHELLTEHDDHDPDDGALWDVMITDEGHKLKNPRMQLRKALDELPVALRVVISGTPIQNNLLEMWALFNFCAPDLLGDAADFRDRYEKAITNGSDKHATQYERERGAVAAARLRQEIAPYMLRREKKEVFKSEDSEQLGGGGAGTAGGASDTGPAAAAAAGGGSTHHPTTMPHKNDLIVWLRLKPMQSKVYQAFLNSDTVKKVFNQTASALAAITVLKKVCDHPALLSDRAANGIVSGLTRARRQAEARAGRGGGSSEDEIEDSSEEEWLTESDDCSSEGEAERQRKQRRQRKAKPGKKSVAKQQAQQREATPPGEQEAEWSQWASADLENQLLDEVHTTGFESSCKTVFVMALLQNLVAEGHRTLIFSQSRVMLNILESAIREQGWRFCRIDGSVASAAERQARVHQFQTSSSIPIFLLTSQVGGLGLTLTAGDRVIIVDPAWNPSTDNQSVDRAYRIGQRKDVVVYRLISCGTVEEKIYRRQVFKGGLSRTGMEDGEQFRYFAQQDLRDLFRLEASEMQSSRTQKELHAMHAQQRRETAELRQHLEYLASLECFAGVSDHDLLFSKKEREGAPAAAAVTASSLPRASGSRGAAPGSTAAAGSSPRKGVYSKAANQGWSGGSELSDLFARAVTISGGSKAGPSAAAAAAAQPPGAAWGGGGSAAAADDGPSSRRLSGSSKDPGQERVEELEDLLERKRHLLTLSAGLADGGARVRSQIAELEQELAVAKKAAANRRAPAAADAAAPAAAATTARAAAPPARPGPSAAGAATASATATPAVSAARPTAAGAMPAPQAQQASRAGSLPAAGAGGSRSLLVAAAAAVQLPSTTAAPGPAAPAPAAAAAVAAPVPVPPRPAASPLLSRMKDMWFGSGKKQAAAVGRTSADAEAGGTTGRALPFGGAGDAPAPWQVQQGAAARQQPQQQPHQQAPRQQQMSEDEAMARAMQAQLDLEEREKQERRHERRQRQQQEAEQQPQQPQQQPVQQRPLHELKRELRDLLQAIKEQESGGMYERAKVDKMRRRAQRLVDEYDGRKAAARAALPDVVLD